MDYFAEQLQRPVFVIVTDDPVWAEGQIPPGFLPVFTGQMFQILRDILGGKMWNSFDKREAIL